MIDTLSFTEIPVDIQLNWVYPNLIQIQRTDYCVWTKNLDTNYSNRVKFCSECRNSFTSGNSLNSSINTRLLLFYYDFIFSYCKGTSKGF